MTIALLKPKIDVENDTEHSYDEGVATAPRVLIPDCEYEAQATGFKIVPFHKLNKIYIRLSIIAGEHSGKEVWHIPALR